MNEMGMMRTRPGEARHFAGRRGRTGGIGAEPGMTPEVDVNRTARQSNGGAVQWKGKTGILWFSDTARIYFNTRKPEGEQIGILVARLARETPLKKTLGITKAFTRNFNGEDGNDVVMFNFRDFSVQETITGIFRMLNGGGIDAAGANRILDAMASALRKV